MDSIRLLTAGWETQMASILSVSQTTHLTRHIQSFSFYASSLVLRNTHTSHSNSDINNNNNNRNNNYTILGDQKGKGLSDSPCWTVIMNPTFSEKVCDQLCFIFFYFLLIFLVLFLLHVLVFFFYLSTFCFCFCFFSYSSLPASVNFCFPFNLLLIQ